jgi:hypothetical protein
MSITGPVENLPARVRALEVRAENAEAEALCLRERVRALEGRRKTADTPTVTYGRGQGLTEEDDKNGFLRSICATLGVPAYAPAKKAA